MVGWLADWSVLVDSMGEREKTQLYNIRSNSTRMLRLGNFFYLSKHKRHIFYVLVHEKKKKRRHIFQTACAMWLCVCMSEQYHTDQRSHSVQKCNLFLTIDDFHNRFYVQESDSVECFAFAIRSHDHFMCIVYRVSKRESI